MKTMLVTAAAVACLSVCSTATFAKDYIVNGQAASTAEVQFLVSHGVQPGTWVIDGYGIGPANTGSSAEPATGSNAKKCWYVLDVLFCD